MSLFSLTKQTRRQKTAHAKQQRLKEKLRATHRPSVTHIADVLSVELVVEKEELLKAGALVTAGTQLDFPQGPQPPEGVTTEELERLQAIHAYLHAVLPRVIETSGRPGAPVLSRPEAGGRRVRNIYVEEGQKLRVVYED